MSNQTQIDNPQVVNTPAVMQQSRPAPIPMGRGGVQLASLEDAFRFSKAVVNSGFAPKGMEREESILVAIQLGLEVGLTPMAALQNIAVINGRPGIYGDAALALVRSSGLLERYSQRHDGEGDNRRAVVVVKRKGEEATEVSFSVADAKKAELWGKAGPWRQYPDRMLLFRARGFALRDAFGDVLKGLRTTEELADIPPAEPVNVTPPARKLSALLGAPVAAADAPAAESAQSAPASEAEPEPAASGETAAESRDDVVNELNNLMLDHAVSETKLFDYARRAKLVPADIMDLWELPTDTLAKLRFAVPTLGKKGGK
ncbi:hypothetical protein OpiT1DRAFT_01266 [Opitutaceae bacterium TAV1]|nr:hypothetical protein OpiT1DRAFT_01266 [Opitutaceae bacterium TAV1]